MTALEEAKAALAQGELNAEMGVPVSWSEVRALHGVIRALVAELERPVTDEQADAASLAFHEFVFGPNLSLSKRARGIQRQAWKVALEAARSA